ncbi:hypothetical protein BH09DEP1_BH09DEP1_8190 [soil metagenome]
MQKVSYFNVCKNLIATDLIIFKQSFVDKFIDLSIWIVLTTVVTSYILPYFGLAHDFGVFQLGGLIAAAGLFEMGNSNVVDLVSDFEGDRVISFNFTLPIPSWLALISKAGFYFITYTILALLMLPIGKLCLWNQFDLTSVHYPKLILAILALSLFYASFALLVTSMLANLAKMGQVWSRFIFPLWFLGGFQFSWMAFYKTLPWLAILNLANPMIYITEAVRVALLGQHGFINFWLCLLAILIFAALSLYLGITRLKKRLDFV